MWFIFLRSHKSVSAAQHRIASMCSALGRLWVYAACRRKNILRCSPETCKRGALRERATSVGDPRKLVKNTSTWMGSWMKEEEPDLYTKLDSDTTRGKINSDEKSNNKIRFIERNRLHRAPHYARWFVIFFVDFWRRWDFAMFRLNFVFG